MDNTIIANVPKVSNVDVKSDSTDTISTEKLTMIELKLPEIY